MDRLSHVRFSIMIMENEGIIFSITNLGRMSHRLVQRSIGKLTLKVPPRSRDNFTTPMEETRAEYMMSRLGPVDDLLVPSGPFDVIYEDDKLKYITAENYPYPSDVLKQLARSTKRYPLIPPPAPIPWTPESSTRRINTTGLSFLERFTPKGQ